MLELPPIPDKEFFSIGEVSSISQLPAYVLRYWESEFKFLRPARRNSGQRKYIRKDIETIFTIKDLLYNRKFTIAGAKKHFLGEKRQKKEVTTGTDVQLNMEINSNPAPAYDSETLNVVKEAKKELEEILKLLQ